MAQGGVSEFNAMLKAFVEDLAYVFDDVKEISMFASGFDDLVSVSVRKPMELFMDAVRPHAGLIMARDPALFDVLAFPGGIDFKRLWASNVSEDTRTKIWEYLQTLMLLGNMVVSAVPQEILSSLPEDVMNTVEALAAEFTEKLQSGDVDFEAMIQHVAEKTKDMDLSALKDIDMNGLVSTLESAGLPPALLKSLTAALPDETTAALAMLEAPAPPLRGGSTKKPKPGPSASASAKPKPSKKSKK